MFRRENVLAATLSVLVVLASTVMAGAETVEVTPSLKITKHTYDAAINEQPFYGFLPKNEAMLAADMKFIDAVERNTGREAGADQFEAVGWDAVRNGDYATAAKRFNQAWLLSPGRSAPVHGLAVVAAERFGDIGFAIELAAGAAGLRHPLPTLPGDHGGLLIKAGKPDQAVPLLERAAAALPSWINPRINLATARFEMGDVVEACRHLVEVERMLQERPAARSRSIEGVYRSLGEKARCVSP